MRVTVAPATAALAHVRGHAARFVDELRAFVRIPSVSAQPEHAPDLARCAAWLAHQLRAAGLRGVQALPTGGPPLIYGHWLERPDRPTLLVYGHYDVQPAGPASAWTFPPFAAAIDGDYLTGRGSSDDKGQLYTHVKAIEACLRSSGALPVNVRCLFEGEEEIGSKHLRPWLARNHSRLRADVAVVSDTTLVGATRPSVTHALRGQLSVELQVTRPGGELHSGKFGGLVGDPVQSLCALIASLTDGDGRIAIPGFAAQVRRDSPAERRYLAAVGPSREQLAAETQSAPLPSRPEETAYERITARPSLTVTGIEGGYVGPGSKNAVATGARARLDFRLVAIRIRTRSKRCCAPTWPGARWLAWRSPFAACRPPARSSSTARIRCWVWPRPLTVGAFAQARCCCARAAPSRR